jgi:2'-5' RNA ligase
VGSLVPPLSLAYPGLGAFPVPERARVVFAAVEETGGALRTLAKAVGERFGALGYPPEARAFTPHVTLGRLRQRPGARLVEAVEAARSRALGEETLSEVKLILSAPEEGRYRYIDLTTVSLGVTGSPGGTE